MVDLLDDNERVRITNMLGHGGQGRQRAIAEIMRGKTGVPAFDQLAVALRAQRQGQSEFKAMLARPVPVNRIGPGGGKR